MKFLTDLQKTKIATVDSIVPLLKCSEYNKEIYLLDILSNCIQDLNTFASM